MKLLYFLIGAAVAALLVYVWAFFYAWHQNATAGAKYDINQLNEFFKLIAAQGTALTVNHSLFNTPIPWLNDLIAKFKGGSPNA